MPYSPRFCRMARCNSCTLKPRTKGHSWDRLPHMWKQYLHHGEHTISGRRARTRHGKMKFFQGLPYKGPVFTKTVITLSFGVRVRSTSTQTTHGERVNPENTPCLRQEAWSTLKFSLKHDFLALKVKVYHLPQLSRQVSKHIGTPLEGNPSIYGEYQH